jgi:hypothetical protein
MMLNFIFSPFNSLEINLYKTLNVLYYNLKFQHHEYHSPPLRTILNHSHLPNTTSACYLKCTLIFPPPLLSLVFPKKECVLSSTDTNAVLKSRGPTFFSHCQWFSGSPVQIHITLVINSVHFYMFRL